MNSHVGPLSLNSVLPIHIALYIANLKSKGLSCSTIKTYISALSFVFKLNNIPEPTSSLLVSKALLGAQRTTTQLPQLSPITKPVLVELLTCLDHLSLSPYRKVLTRAMFLLAFFGCLRASEYLSTRTSKHMLLLDDITVKNKENSKYLLINFRSYKHSKNACKIRIPPSTSSNCPVSSIERYLHLRGRKPGPFFVSGKNSPIPRNAFAQLLKRCVTYTGKDPSAYNTHSFRIGRATQLAVEGHSEDTIKKAGRWNSHAFVKYIRPSVIALPS